MKASHFSNRHGNSKSLLAMLQVRLLQTTSAQWCLIPLISQLTCNNDPAGSCMCPPNASCLGLVFALSSCVILPCSVTAGTNRQIAIFSIAVGGICTADRFCSFTLHNTSRWYFFCGRIISCWLHFAAGTSEDDGKRERRDLPIIAKATFGNWPRNAFQFLRDTSYVSQSLKCFSFAHRLSCVGTSRFSSKLHALNFIASTPLCGGDIICTSFHSYNLTCAHPCFHFLSLNFV